MSTHPGSFEATAVSLYRGVVTRERSRQRAAGQRRRGIIQEQLRTDSIVIAWLCQGQPSQRSNNESLEHGVLPKDQANVCGRGKERPTYRLLYLSSGPAENSFDEKEISLFCRLSTFVPPECKESRASVGAKKTSGPYEHGMAGFTGLSFHIPQMSPMVQRLQGIWVVVACVHRMNFSEMGSRASAV